MPCCTEFLLQISGNSYAIASTPTEQSDSTNIAGFSAVAEPAEQFGDTDIAEFDVVTEPVEQFDGTDIAGFVAAVVDVAAKPSDSENVSGLINLPAEAEFDIITVSAEQAGGTDFTDPDVDVVLSGGENTADFSFVEHDYCQPSRTPPSTFSHPLLIPPHRERRPQVRAKLPSYNLTGKEHIDFVEQKIAKKLTGGKRKKKTADEARGNAKKSTKVAKQKKGVGKLPVSEGEGKRKRKKKTVAADKENTTEESKQAMKSPEANVSNSGEDRTPCAYCKIVYCQSKVRWLRCRNCKIWVCGQCANIGRKRTFVCASCI